MLSKITDKFQITIPKEIRKQMKLSRKDALKWKIENGKVVVESVKKPFLAFKGTVRIGEGDIKEDIRKAKKLMVDK